VGLLSFLPSPCPLSPNTESSIKTILKEPLEPEPSLFHSTFCCIIASSFPPQSFSFLFFYTFINDFLLLVKKAILRLHFLSFFSGFEPSFILRTRLTKLAFTPGVTTPPLDPAPVFSRCTYFDKSPLLNSTWFFSSFYSFWVPQLE